MRISNIGKFCSGVISLSLCVAYTAEAGPVVRVMKAEPRSYQEFIGTAPFPSIRDTDAGLSVSINNGGVETFNSTAMTTQGNDCTPNFGTSPYTVAQLVVTPESPTIQVNFTGQGTIPQGTGFAAQSIWCTVTQGAATTACSGTSGGPVIQQRPQQSQNSTGWRSSTAAHPGYNGYVTGLQPGVPATVKFAVSTWPAPTLGSFCFSNLIVNYYVTPPGE